MNDLQIFSNPEFGQVRTVEIDGQPWLVGKDVAVALGYKNTKDAIDRHVNDEDKRQNDGVVIHDSIGREQHPVIINESGLYSLILSSKMPKAKAFKHWVTGEVLPAIRRDGVYQSVKAQQHIEQLEASNARLNTAIQNVSKAKGELADIINLRNEFIKHRDNYKARFLQAKTDYGRMCDNLRQAEALVVRAQAALDSRIDQLQVVAFGLPGFDEIMQAALAATPEQAADKKEDFA